MVVQDGDGIIRLVALNRINIIFLIQISKVGLNAQRRMNVYAEQTYAIIVSQTHTMTRHQLTGYANDVHPVNGIHRMD